MLTKIILVRHGISEWNDDTENDRYNGHTDINLSESGQRQIIRMSEFLKSEKIACFYASPLNRAIKTAKLVASKHNNSVHIINEFIEINFGDWEGLTRKQLVEKYGDIYLNWQKNPAEQTPSNGENGLSAQKRLMPKLFELVNKHKNETIFIAAHKNVNKIILCSLLGINLKYYRNYIPQKAGAINSFYIEKEKLVKIDFIDNKNY